MAADGHLGPSNDVEYSLYPLRATTVFQLFCCMAIREWMQTTTEEAGRPAR
jgi:hypothetical protein